MKSRYSRALVTGGAGFIGSHIVARLLKEGFEVTVIDDLSDGRLETLEIHQNKSGFNFVRGDIRDSEVLKKAMNDIQIVFHEAAFVGGPQSAEKPLLTNDVNVNGTLNLLATSLRSNVECFIFASSAAVYGEHENLPVREDSIPRPNSPYAASKLAAESYMKAYSETYGLATTSLRYFNVYGPGQRYGPYAAVITAFLNQLINHRSPTIYGDGEQTRDFVNVKDVVEANMLAMEKKCVGDVFNIATGSQLTVNELFKMLKELIGSTGQISPVYAQARLSDIRHSCGNYSKAKEILGFEPKVTPKAGLLDLAKTLRKPI